MKHISKDPKETVDLGFKVGKKLKSGDLVALIGELGAGKTLFTKGIAKALGVKEYEYVNSPTFVIVKEYYPGPGRAPSVKRKKLPLYHFDFYRIASSHDLDTVGFEEYFYGDGVTVIEWADRAPDILPRKHISVKFRHLGDNKREIRITRLPKR